MLSGRWLCCGFTILSLVGVNNLLFPPSQNFSPGNPQSSPQRDHAKQSRTEKRCAALRQIGLSRTPPVTACPSVLNFDEKSSTPRRSHTFPYNHTIERYLNMCLASSLPWVDRTFHGCQDFIVTILEGPMHDKEGPAQAAEKSSTASETTTALSSPPALNVATQSMSMGGFLYTLHLVTYDQIYDVIIPGTIFALCAAHSSDALHFLPSSTWTTLLRAPRVAGWLWVLVLQFCLHNQRHPDSIEEDMINKPWRALPSGRITPSQANRILLSTYVVAFILALYLGTFQIFSAYTLLVLTYNEFGGSDLHGVFRNALNAAGYTCFFSSAVQVAIGRNQSISHEAWTWIALLVIALFTTFHAQDFRDVEGDEARGRETIVSWLGDFWSRGLLVGAMLFWTILIPMWFRLSLKGILLPGALALPVIAMTIYGVGKRDKKLDKKMYRVWAFWMVSLCPMPLLAELAKTG
jgi:4-hydroxybenzoate polyprenyltransferase